MCRYNEEDASLLEQEAELANYIDNKDMINIKKSNDFVFFQVRAVAIASTNVSVNIVQGYDSPGGDHFIVPKSSGNVTMIRNICMKSRICIG